MYIIVVGGGKVGFYLTKTLLAEGFEVLLIERNGAKVESFQHQLGAVVMQGDGAEASTLARAGAARADVVIAVTGEDEDNLVICQMAKQRFQAGRAVARVNNPKNEQLFKLLGIDVTVSQTTYIMHLIEQSLPDTPFVHLLSLNHPDLAIVDAKVSEQSAVANSLIGQIELPENCIIAAVLRGAHLMIPTPTTKIAVGDDVIAIAHRDQEDALRRLLV
jgi:trk system potassium uptake protein TrkA